MLAWPAKHKLAKLATACSPRAASPGQPFGHGNNSHSGDPGCRPYRVGARSLGPFLSFSVRLSIGITSRPIFDPVLVGLVLWVAGWECLSRQHLAAAPAYHAGGWSAARYRRGPGSSADGQGTVPRPGRPRSPSGGVSRRRGARKIAMTPMMTCACSCDGAMPRPQETRACQALCAGGFREPAFGGGPGPDDAAGDSAGQVIGTGSRVPRDAWLRAGHADQCPVTSPVLTCQG
jgi:hypothetical protein